MTIHGPVLIYHPDAVREIAEQAYQDGFDDGAQSRWRAFHRARKGIFHARPDSILELVRRAVAVLFGGDRSAHS